MKSLSIREMRNQLGNLEALINAENEIIVTRHNKPLARILPIRGTRPKPTHQALRDLTPYQEIPSEVLVAMDREER